MRAGREASGGAHGRDVPFQCSLLSFGMDAKSGTDRSAGAGNAALTGKRGSDHGARHMGRQLGASVVRMRRCSAILCGTQGSVCMQHSPLLSLWALGVVSSKSHGKVITVNVPSRGRDVDVYTQPGIANTRSG